MTRTVSGLVIPWDEVGYTARGHVTVAQGSIALPDDIGRVKLFRDHSTEPGSVPVGYATAARETPAGLEMDFCIAATPDGDTALADVRERVRDALSVELIDVQLDDGQITSARMTGVALVAVPAFSDARVTPITASILTDRTLTMTMPTTLHAGLATDQPAPADDACEQSHTDEQVTPTDPDTTPEPPTDPDAPAVPSLAAAQAPRGLITGPGRPQLTFSAAVDAIASMRTGGSPELTAALADITRSANPAISAPAWLGELWDGAEYTREIIPTMTQKALTRLKGVGFRWVKRPEVGDYAGDKAEIPTGTVSTEPVEVTAKRMAAGHDIDRAYFDFNETEFLNAFFRARVTDYAMKTDIKAAEFLVASAKTGKKVSAEPDLLHAAARARLEIKRQTRTEPTNFLVNPTTMFGLFDITQLDNPAYLSLLGVKPEKFIASDLVPEGEVIAYCKQAVTWFELAGSPIRVDAERIDHGGKDSGIFGYYATLLNNQNGIIRVPITKPATGA